MYYLRHTDEQCIVSIDRLEPVDGPCDCAANDDDEQQVVADSGCTETMASWFASDEAAFWMSL